ncbi:MAG: hypothetical protein JWR84_2106 [Caulobacter sp.]|nr:hypothetical protein [Caulobacter sp.]
MQNRRSAGAPGIANHPIHAMLVPFPIVLFVGVLFTDVAYRSTADPLWSTMSSWLLLAGLIVASIAILLELIGFLGDQSFRRRLPVRIHLLGNGLAVLLSVLNFVFHVRDGYSAVVPAGPLLSAAVVLVLLLTFWLGRRSAHAHRAHAADDGATGRKEA